ncbi:MAG: SAM-dependent methyltransferase, partial [Chloroflexi bacterium]|nr:SAM-dependent methyltransferase [Chloroflexota bacterium]
KGAITFEEFHSLALYWPEGGYYATRNPVGVAGDFFTAPHTHPLFGTLISHLLQQQWDLLGSPARFWAVELGAGNGRLAGDALANLPGLSSPFSSALDYVGVDVQPYRSAPGSRLQRVQSGPLPFRSLTGCVLANELLDAMPVHRVTLEHGELREVYVTLSPDGALSEQTGSLSTPALAERFADLGVRLSEGYRAEVNLGLDEWFSDLSRSTTQGYVLLIDYGHDAPVFYDESRRRGTLRCYYRHTLNANPYQHVGSQDISVHVEFTSVMRAAERHGFAVRGYTTQRDFLMGLGLGQYREAIDQRRDLSAQVRHANLKAVDMLTAPDGMGGFKVLALGKGVPDAPLQGFTGEEPRIAPELLEDPPMLTLNHLFSNPANQEVPDLPSWHDLIT